MRIEFILFPLWSEPVEADAAQFQECDRVEVPEICLEDMVDDAFTAIARDGAGAVEVAERLLEALGSLASIGDASMRDAAIHHARLALARAESVLRLPEDLEVVQDAAGFARSP